MNLQIVKERILVNNVFETMDDTSGLVQVPNGNFHDCEYGPSLFFGEGDEPPAVNTTTQTWDKVPNIILYGTTEDEVAKNYLKAFYFWLLMKLPTNQTPGLQAKSINVSEDLENLFTNLPSMYTAETCLLSTHIDFAGLLNTPYASQALQIRFQQGGKHFNRDLLAWGEPLVLLPGPRKNKLITAESNAITLNQPQFLKPLRNNMYGVELQLKVIFPNEIKIFAI